MQYIIQMTRIDTQIIFPYYWEFFFLNYSVTVYCIFLRRSCVICLLFSPPFAWRTGSEEKADLRFLLLVLYPEVLSFHCNASSKQCEESPHSLSPLFIVPSSSLGRSAAIHSFIMCKVQTAASNIRKKSTFEKAFRWQGFISSHII